MGSRRTAFSSDPVRESVGAAPRPQEAASRARSLINALAEITRTGGSSHRRGATTCSGSSSDPRSNTRGLFAVSAGPPHDRVRKARRSNLVPRPCRLTPAGSGLSTRSSCPSSPPERSDSPVAGEVLSVAAPSSCCRLLAEPELGFVAPRRRANRAEAQKELSRCRAMRRRRNGVPQRGRRRRSLCSGDAFGCGRDLRFAPYHGASIALFRNPLL